LASSRSVRMSASWAVMAGASSVVGVKLEQVSQMFA
jgi:hypothetical protein